MTSSESSDGRKFGILPILGQVTAIALVFYAGMLFQERQDSPMIRLLSEKCDYYQNRLTDTLSVEDYFVNFELAQMSPIGERRLLAGSASLSETRSELRDSILTAIGAIEMGESAEAVATLNWAAAKLPGFAYTYYYLGIAETSNMPSRAKAHFVDAHSRFAFLLRIKPDNSAMRIYDAMTLTHLGLGDSATLQLYRAQTMDPEWEGFTCERMMIDFDTTALSKEEKRAWSDFAQGLEDVRCDTTRISAGSFTLDRRTSLPTIHWPTGYGTTR